MTCFRRKGKSFVHTAPRIRSAVFRIPTGFPCSAEQSCVSIYDSGSRICHKVSRIYRKPPNGGGFSFPIPLQFPMERYQGAYLPDGGPAAFCTAPVPVGAASGQSSAGWHAGSSIKGLRKGDHANQIIQSYSVCIFFASCWSRFWFASTFFSAFLSL